MSSPNRMSPFPHRELLRSAAFLLPLVLCRLIVGASAQQSPEASSLNGTIRDARGVPLVQVNLRLQSQEANREYAARTDARGHYQFPVLPAGVYVLHAQAEGYAQLDLPPVFVSPEQSKTVDLTMQLAAPSSSTKPQFFDEPQFSVAGVTDTTNLGGHGSDVVVRTRDTLARDTASLAESPKSLSSPESMAAEKSLRQTINRDPYNFDANHHLGQLLLNAGKPREALVYFDRAAKIHPDDYQNNYEQARAIADAGNYALARTAVQSMLRSQDKAELHHLLADVDEKSGDPLDAVRQYQRAAELDASEHYLFDWGAELLLHHAPEPALQVFTKGSQLFPRSERMLIALGAAAYANGSYDDAVRHICNASNVNPDDPAPYLFLGRMLRAENKPSEQMVEHLHRFVTLHPDSADSNYYYALALWKYRKDSRQQSSPEVESLLAEALSLNPSLAAAHLQLGILHAEAGNYVAAVSNYQEALKLDPQLEEGHYRLAQAYRQTGKPEQAKEELRLYDLCVKESAKRIEEERHQIRQFVYTLRNSPPAQNE